MGKLPGPESDSPGHRELRRHSRIALILREVNRGPGPNHGARGKIQNLPNCSLLLLTTAFSLLFVIVPLPEPALAASSGFPHILPSPLITPHTAVGEGGYCKTAIKTARNPTACRLSNLLSLSPGTTGPADLPTLTQCQQPPAHSAPPTLWLSSPRSPQSSPLPQDLCTCGPFCEQCSFLLCAAPLSALSLSCTTSKSSFLAMQCNEPT